MIYDVYIFSASGRKMTIIYQKVEIGDYMSRKHIEIDPVCGRRLKSLLTKRKVTQCALAEKLDCQPQHVSHVVCGKRRLTAELAQRIVDEVFLDINIEWLLNRSECETIAEKEEYSQKMWEDGQRVSAFYDKIFQCFIESLEDMRGYGLRTGESNLLTGEYIAVTNAIGEPVGAIPAESFQRLRTEVENYASYLIQRIIKDELEPIPGSGKEGIEKWQTFKSAGTSPAS